MKTILLAGALGLFLSGTALAVPPEGYRFLTYDAGLAQAATSGKPVFVYLGREGCGACRKTNRQSFSDPALRELLTAHYELVYVDTEGGRRITLPGGERVTEMQLAAALRTLGTPQFIYLLADGAPVLRVPGFRTADEFRQFDGYVRGGHFRTQSLNEYLSREP